MDPNRPRARGRDADRLALAAGLVALAVLAILAAQPLLGRLVAPASTPPGWPSSAAGSASPNGPSVGPASPSLETASPDDPILLAAGDIAGKPDGPSGNDELTARVLDRVVAVNPGRVTIAAVGDLAYETGTAQEFAARYDPTWGRHRDITLPVPGNHEYKTPGATGYYAYWGARAGEPGLGYYAQDVGAWRVYALNSEIAHGNGSAQVQWLRSDLARHPAVCVLAFTHHPRFSSGSHGSDAGLTGIWQALQDAGAEILLGGHDHNYQRFAPQTATGVRDDGRGVRQWVVGMGGIGLYRFDRPIANSEAWDTGGYGVLQLTLHPASYDFRYLGVDGNAYTDSGTGIACH